MALSVPIRCPEHPCRSPIVASSRLDMQPLRVCEGGINTLAVGQWRRLCVGNVCQFDHYLDGKNAALWTPRFGFKTCGLTHWQ